MIYTVTFNPSLDYIIGVDHFKLGQVNRTKSEVIFPGGKGINVSMVLKNMGIDSVALGFCGGFTGEEFVRLIQEKGIKTELIKVKEGITRINVKMKSDEESEINGQGPNILPSDIEILYRKLDQLKDGDILVLAGSIPDVMPKSIYMDIMEYLKDKKIDIVVDATKNLLVNVLEHKPFLVKPNNHELGEIYGVELKTRDEVVPYAKKMQEAGARNVLVSMAGEGAVLLTEDGQVLQSEAPKGTVVNSVGAGDSMVAGFITGYLDKKDYKEAFTMGVCTGSASAFSVELATKAEVEALRKNNQHLF
ncbi:MULTISPECIES: 1-phosphofructokinase [Agathobacter]|uniref:Tagatose-6-phosphate kinase n=1 Tax=Agathobacter ruminis TaxID=1712665 RepID=A0A2G3E625_9FIRM|nr:MULTISPECIES: 1-phosphofructokinase [Agathobacter]MBQ1680676.1 1-phosphofructokinase [Agathobacter sp.]MDC7301613.1 1-phosphofructokinase [Agathobacter ruminis]PHU38697.1 1-phosphofructokinase [Agathobacter ruminis]